jgi:hypothetical protein
MAVTPSENLMPQIVSTQHGDIALVSPPIKLLQAVRRFLPFGATRYVPPKNGADFGLVMQCGEREVIALTQRSQELEERYGVHAYQANSILIAHALAGYVKRGISGLLMPSAYMRKLPNGNIESGIGYIGTPSRGDEWLSKLSSRSVSDFIPSRPNGSDSLDRNFIDPAFDEEFGHGFILMVGSFIECIQESAASTNIALFPCQGFTARPRLEMGVLGFGFMVVDQSIICLKTKFSPDDPVWVALLAGGIREVYHLPSIPIGISEAQLAVTKNAPDLPDATSQASSGRAWPEAFFPLSGCRILVHEETNKPYSMPIRPAPPIADAGVEDPDDAQAWYKFAYNNERLSKGEKVACLQRAVILDQRNPGLWYTLGCHYELEGEDWYRAANAFNHVIFLHPKSGTAWFSLSQLWAARGFMSKAQECRARFDALSQGEGAHES